MLATSRRLRNVGDNSSRNTFDISWRCDHFCYIGSWPSCYRCVLVVIRIDNRYQHCWQMQSLTEAMRIILT